MLLLLLLTTLRHGSGSQPRVECRQAGLVAQLHDGGASVGPHGHLRPAAIDGVEQEPDLGADLEVVRSGPEHLHIVPGGDDGSVVDEPGRIGLSARDEGFPQLEP